MDNDNEPASMPVPQAHADPITSFGQPKPCGECKFGLSVGLDQPLQCHLNEPRVFGFIVQGPKGQPEVIHSTEYPRVQRKAPGCQHHQPKTVA